MARYGAREANTKLRQSVQKMAAAVEVIGITELPEPVVQQPLRKASPTTTIGIGQQMGPEEKLEKLDELLRQATELGLVDNQMIDKMKRNIREVRTSFAAPCVCGT